MTEQKQMNQKSSNKKTDTRIQYTKHMLKTALIQILREKPIHAVTVKELCEQAGINRGTFYLHYASPEDALQEIQHDFLNDNRDIMQNWSKNYAHSETDLLIPIFTSMRNDRDTMLVLFGPNGNSYFVENMRSFMKEQIVSVWHTEFPEIPREHLEFNFDFVFNGSMRVMLNWIKGDTYFSPEELSHRLERLGHYCLIAAKEYQ